MIVHFVFFKIGPEITNAKIEEMYAGIKSLSALPGVLKVECGRQEEMYEGYADRAKGYTHGLVVYLATRTDLAAYDADPRHLEVKGLIGSCVDKSKPDPVMAMDWEIDSNL